MEPLTIKPAVHAGIKDDLKSAMGKFATALAPRRARQLYRNPVAEPSSAMDRAIMSHLRRRCLAENRQRYFERLHKNYWSGSAGAKFSENCDHRFNDLFLAKQQSEFAALREVWNAMQPDKIVEVGTNSGLLLQYFTQNLTGVTQSLGIDINADQIKRNQQSNTFDRRIEFLQADGLDWILNNAKPATLFVTNGGVLEYFHRQRLDDMLNHIATNCRPAIFFASEPIADDHDFAITKQSIPFGDEHSFSHNYTDLFESNRFKIVHQRAVMFDSWKMLCTIATT